MKIIKLDLQFFLVKFPIIFPLWKFGEKHNINNTLIYLKKLILR